MRKEDKTLLIDKIKETLDQYSVVYLANTTSLNAEKTVDLRRVTSIIVVFMRPWLALPRCC